MREGKGWGVTITVTRARVSMRDDGPELVLLTNVVIQDGRTGDPIAAVPIVLTTFDAIYRTGLCAHLVTPIEEYSGFLPDDPAQRMAAIETAKIAVAGSPLDVPVQLLQDAVDRHVDSCREEAYEMIKSTVPKIKKRRRNTVEMRTKGR